MAYFDLGSYGRKVSTSSPEAQLWFDRGLNWLYGFNHGEAIRCFAKATEHDPECAMAHWGISYASGPNYNLPWHLYDPNGRQIALAASYDAMQMALAHAGGATPVEQALIQALPARYPQREAIEDMAPWDKAYTNEMRKIFESWPDDLDVRTVFVESIMNETPWKMWNLSTGKPAEGAGTEEAMAALEHAFSRIPASWDHPGLLHLYVHLMEMSPFPQRALRAGDRLRAIMPDSGHLIHMPTHLDVLCGFYRDVLVYNQKALEPDRRFLAYAEHPGIYLIYVIHNFHFAIYGAMFLGQYTPAIAAAEELIATVPEAVLRIESPPMADFLEAYLTMKQHVLVRFGKWREIIAQDLPKDQELYCSNVAMMHYARAVAHSALGNVAEAETEKAQFMAAKTRVPDSRRVHNNTVVDLLGVAEEMLMGELEYRKGNHDAAFAHLRRSVALDDALPYDEPWGWMQPTRHALGALLLEQGRVDEAEAVYRADLGLDGTLSRACQHPDNLWSLHGLHECLTRRGDTVEAPLIKQRLDLAVARAEVPVKASCFCRRTAMAAE
ncbi:tetratricopeptide repeat protein [Limibaculum sp. M0105]|uniref:Tetratricopeptide repeat protein n=1 Tax=Thermohalobaculum xanthum TaxID=2753746 RepID=A0A8J7MBK2_9RHOB|nr:tetratricopeptide repeat protein [Thermohalobaculum xanthum]MBK0401283.1 tetratricopeptide repeat protein [Thermohalobaculum xanthum]